MTAYPDTSFLCAFYRLQVNSTQAAAYFAKLVGPLEVSSLLLFEFRQSVRFQVRLHRLDRMKGFPAEQGATMLDELKADLAAGVIVVRPFPWPEVHARAERLSERHTDDHGHRVMDILHVAAALTGGATKFLTFDANQKKLAVAEGLVVPL